MTATKLSVEAKIVMVLLAAHRLLHQESQDKEAGKAYDLYCHDEEVEAFIEKHKPEVQKVMHNPRLN